MNITHQAPLGRTYNLDGQRLWLHRTGSGGPAVVFLPGASAVGLDYLNIHDRVAQFTTSVVYDRGGTGWSGPAALPRTVGEVATELRHLLRTADVAPPYVLVAHSIGGAYARRYIQLFPDDVAGVVYLDAFYEEWDTHMPQRLHLKPQAVPGPLALKLISLLARGMYRRMFATWPAKVRQTLIDQHLTVAWQLAGALERGNQPDVRDEIKAAGAVPEVPSIVLTALGVDPGLRLIMSPRAIRELGASKRGLYDALAASVPGSEHRTLDNARHSTIAIDSPDAVTQAVRDLWQRVR